MKRFVRQILQGFLIILILDISLFLLFDRYAELGMYKYLIIIIPYALINLGVERLVQKRVNN